MLEERMVDLKRELTEYAGFVQAMIQKSVHGLLARDGAALSRVVNEDEPSANDREISLDELCISTIAQFEPRAKDLRSVLMTLQMTKDLERMADHAVNIAEHGLYLVDRPEVKPLIDIPAMVAEVTAMVRDSLAAFVKEDVGLAKDVCGRDSVVDRLNGQVVRELIACMTADPSTIERGLHLIDIAKNLERIADLTTNVGEDVIFMVQGRVIKHHKDEEVRRG